LLRGTLLEKRPNQVIVDVGGVGYEVTVPISTFSSLPPAGAEVRLRTFTYVREDTLALYGFLTEEEQFLFERLIGISGIGPRLAVTVLSGLPVAELVASIRQGLVEHLVRIPGVGKKTAERIVLELREKLGAFGPAAAAPAPGPVLGAVEQDVLSALINLGCARPAAEAAVRKARQQAPEESFEPLFRRALALVR